MCEATKNPVNEKNSSDCIEVLEQFANGLHGAIIVENAAFCKRLAHTMRSHPRVGRIIRHIILHRYEKDTGIDVGTANWQTIIAWLLENLPAILKLILSFMSLFDPTIAAMLSGTGPDVCNEAKPDMEEAKTDATD